MTKTLGIRAATTAIAAAILVITLGAQDQQGRPTGQGFSFRTGVELINVTATVTDAQGRFVQGLTMADFEVYEDGRLQTISQFDSERVPVSLGIAIDTSGSMAGEKMAAAQSAVNRFLYDLLGDQDEVFLYRFDSRVTLVSGWTENRRSVGHALGSISPNGGTAMYDAVVASVPLAQSGSRRKKALVVISDGNDMSSKSDVNDARKLIRESEVMVYAIGIDASGASPSPYPNSSSTSGSTGSSSSQPSGGSSAPKSGPIPSAFPRARVVPQPPRQPSTSKASSSSSGRSVTLGGLNVDALRAITDDSGGRTEIIFSTRDLEPATANIANELSRQYFLGYSTSIPKDGRWHSIEVRVRKGNYTIRARKGFIAG